jgi:hypothetical protein
MIEMAVTGPEELPRDEVADNRVAGLESFKRALEAARRHFFAMA